MGDMGEEESREVSRELDRIRSKGNVPKYLEDPQFRSASDRRRNPLGGPPARYRKLSGFNVPSKANKAAFDRAIEEVTDTAQTLISSLVTSAQPRNRDLEAKRARARSAARFPPRS